MKRAHETAAYEAWFRERVQASIDDPRPSVGDDQGRAWTDARRQMLLMRASAKPTGDAVGKAAR